MVRRLNALDVSFEYQSSCIRAWLEAGFDVATLNNEREAALIRKYHPDVRVIITPSERVFIHEFLSTALIERQKIGGIVNADCLFTGNSAVAHHIEAAAVYGMLAMERINLDPDGLTLGESCNGFDAFFFNSDILPQIVMSKDMRLGDTWWDYIFPLAYRAAGGQLYKSSPFLLHLDHPLAWDVANYARGGRIAKTLFSGRQGLPRVENDDLESVSRFAVDVWDLLRAVSKPVNLQGDGVAAEMMDQVAWNALKATMPKPGIDYEEIARQAVGRYRASRPPLRRLGEFFCTAALVLHKLDPQNRLADALFRVGDDLQFPLYAHTRSSDRQD